jgi:hypothetical protein
MTHIRSQNQRGMTVAQFLHNQEMQTYTPFVIEAGSGIGHYVYGGNRFTVKDFKEMFPVPFSLVKFNGQEMDPDPRRRWLNS